MKDAKKFMEALKKATLDYVLLGTCNSQSCGHMRSYIKK